MCAAPQSRCEAARWDDAGLHPAADVVLEEVPVAMVYNGISHAVMLASPADLEDFAVGFSLTEGVVQSAAEIRDIEAVPCCDGIELQLAIAAGRMAELKLRRRALAGRTGCGLCGVESLQHAVRPATRVPATGARISADALQRAFRCLAQEQVLHRATGAAHAAGFATWAGELMLVREDVGRHNALDKLVGAMCAQGLRGEDGIALITSRASYEMVHKAAAAHIGLLAALSAPTGLAIRAAAESGLTLAGFAGRPGRRVYTSPERCAS
ncbi:MAG: formate dehydrogenase accessory sulfurtransferase FdhD [Variovorax sp.]|nr:formate dehydrogenase accessory sulfurtransferase FdhD [Variovorax sp.]